jgi:hypothetical protein
MKKLLLFCFCWMMLLQAKANLSEPANLMGEEDTVTIKIPFNKATRAISAGLSVGTQGIGLEAQLPILKQWQLRFGGTFLPVALSQDYLVFPSRTAVVQLDADYAKLHLIADWEPFQERTDIISKLNISGGLAYFMYAKGKATVMLKDPYQYGDIEMSPEEVGQLIVDSDWKGLAPYLGVGMNRLKTYNNLSLDAAFGMFYLPSPDVTITGSKMLQDNSHNADQLRKNLNSYRFHPTLQFSINYTFNKGTE